MIELWLLLLFLAVVTSWVSAIVIVGGLLAAALGIIESLWD